jgi:hypothetical protein
MAPGNSRPGDCKNAAFGRSGPGLLWAQRLHEHLQHHASWRLDSDIKTAGVVESPTGVYIPPELANYAQEVPVSGWGCGAWSVPVTMGPGLVQSLEAANHKALRNQLPGASAHLPVPGAKYNIAIALAGC